MIACIFGASAVHAFDFDDAAAMAERRAQTPYQPPASPLPAELRALTYDQYRDIRFRPDHALWRDEGLPFEVMFFHVGRGNEPVRINEVASEARHLEYDPERFDYGNNNLSPSTWGDLNYAGFRIHYPLNRPDYRDEVIVFLGASYFRALAAGTRYGLSARGLAIDTVGGRGEEFPRFTDFWLVKPKADDGSLRLIALLDSPSVTGAYEFDVLPGQETIVAVRGRIFLRAPVATLGMAPLTSMFLFGENQPNATDFRPEVHDSDGLMVYTGQGEWLWRPLLNPPTTTASSFSMNGLRGFGLMQRDRAFHSYEDNEARYEQRPSAWVEPLGAWGPGRVELVQIPTPDETNDNIVAYWVPAELPTPGAPLDFAYRLHWQGSDTTMRPPGAWAVQTRTGRGFADLAPDERQFIIDFAGPSLAALPMNTAVEAVVSAPANGQILETNAYQVEATGAWRMFVRVKQIDRSRPTELRGFLRNGADVLTETWSYLLPGQ